VSLEDLARRGVPGDRAGVPARRWTFAELVEQPGCQPDPSGVSGLPRLRHALLRRRDRLRPTDALPRRIPNLRAWPPAPPDLADATRMRMGRTGGHRGQRVT